MNNEIGTDLASKMVITFRRQVTPMVVKPMIDEPTKRGVHFVFDLITDNDEMLTAGRQRCHKKCWQLVVNDVTMLISNIWASSSTKTTI